jgi:hypothetical protein
LIFLVEAFVDFGVVLMKYLIASMLVFFCTHGSAAEKVVFPEKGGIISKSHDGEYTLAVRYRDGQTKTATASLVKIVKGGKLTPSVGALYKFNVKGCGNMDFVQASSHLPAVLQYDDEVSAGQESECPIYFGSMENHWVIK